MKHKTITLAIISLITFILSNIHSALPDNREKNHNRKKHTPLEIINIVNSKQNKTWEAEPTYLHTKVNSNYDIIKEMTSLLGTFFELKEHITSLISPSSFLSKTYAIPDDFDLREIYPNCTSLSEVRDQSTCGACWAFATTSVISDRICIHNNIDIRISALDVLSCCSNCGNGCRGGHAIKALQFWKEEGIVTGDKYNSTGYCKAYFLPPCDHHGHVKDMYKECGESQIFTPSCKKQCDDDNSKNTFYSDNRISTTLQSKKEYNEEKYFGNSYYSVKNSEREIQMEIFERGSVAGAMKVYEDFIFYKKGVYQYTTGDFLGGHSIKIIGWGEENGEKYWLCVNSWNEDWGDNGYFKILRGVDHCGIESQIIAGMPESNSRRNKRNSSSSDNNSDSNKNSNENSNLKSNIDYYINHIMNGLSLKGLFEE